MKESGSQFQFYSMNNTYIKMIQNNVSFYCLIGSSGNLAFHAFFRILLIRSHWILNAVVDPTHPFRILPVFLYPAQSA